MSLAAVKWPFHHGAFIKPLTYNRLNRIPGESSAISLEGFDLVCVKRENKGNNLNRPDIAPATYTAVEFFQLRSGIFSRLPPCRHIHVHVFQCRLIAAVGVNHFQAITLHGTKIGDDPKSNSRIVRGKTREDENILRLDIKVSKAVIPSMTQGRVVLVKPTKRAGELLRL